MSMLYVKPAHGTRAAPCYLRHMNNEALTTDIKSLLSAAQLAANRANAQKSTGPKSETGKNRSKTNAQRHGLTGQFQALSREDQIAFDKFCNELVADYRPVGPREHNLAISIAQDHWRLHRARATENNIFMLGTTTEIGDHINADHPEVHTAVSHAQIWLEQGRQLQLLTLY